MMADALRAAGIKDAAGNWTGKYGVHSAAQFLASPVAQENALTDYLNDIERQLRANGSITFVGQTIDGRVAPFVVTLGGLIAAAHREGAPTTRDYLLDAEDDGFRTRGRALDAADLRIETRLRTFSGVPYE